jgi:hypothetical protein
MSDKPVRSVFIPMRPTSAPLPSKPAGAPEAALGEPTITQPPKAAREPVKSVQADVVLQLGLCNEPLRKGLGVTFPSFDTSGRRLIVVNLNRANPLVSRALGKLDSSMIKFMAGLLVAEFALMRKGAEAVAIRTTLHSAVGVPVERSRFLSFSYLAAALVDSSLLVQIGRLAIYGPLNESVTGPFEICVLQNLSLLEPSLLWRPTQPPKEGASNG